MQNLSLSALMGCLLAVTIPAAAAFIPGKAGEQTRYRLTYQGTGTVSIRGMLSSQAAGADHIQTQLRSQFEVVQLSSSLISVRLIAPDYTIQQNGQPRDMKREIATLEHPCYLTVNDRGAVQNISFAADTPTAARSLMRSLVSGLEFVRSNGPAHSWQSEQDTSNGTAQVAYRSAGGAAVEKRIVNYPHEREIGPKGMPIMRPVTKGVLRFTFRHSQVEDVNGEFSTSFNLADKTLSDGKERFTLSRVSSEMESGEDLRRLQKDYRSICSRESPTALHAHDTDAAAEGASWAALLKGATPGSLTADLAAADAKRVSNDAGLYSRLCAMMTLHPETCAGFEQMLAKAQPNKLSTRLVIAALAGVAGGSQERPQPDTLAMKAAQSALGRALALCKSEPDMVILIAPALGMSGAPCKESERLLEAGIESKDLDIASSCALALGSLAHNGSPEIARMAVEYLKRKLALANASFQLQLLASLGNAGSVDGLKAISAFAKNSSPQLRATATMSIRLVPGRQAAELLYDGLHDSDPDVRLNAARAWEFRPFSPADIREFTTLVAAEKIERVRKELLENLKLETPYYPQVRNVLAQARKYDASADIRRTVASWL